MRYLILTLLFTLSATVMKAGDIDTIDIAFTKTVMLVFSEPVEITPGSEDIQAIARENKVIIVALEEEFEETNLFVQSGNRYYVFIVRYNKSPRKLLYDYQDVILSSTVTVLDKGQKEKQIEIQSTREFQENQYQQLSKMVFEQKQEVSDIGDINGNIYFMLLNIYIKDELVFFKVGINNKSKINYDIQLISFDIRNIDKRLKPSSDQKVAKQTLYTYNAISRVKAKSNESIVFVLDKFTLDNERKLHIEMWEEGGDRICEFDISAKELLEINQLEDI